jgi:hypothetical protein
VARIGPWPKSVWPSDRGGAGHGRGCGVRDVAAVVVVPTCGQRSTPAEREPANGRMGLAEWWPTPECSARGSKRSKNAGTAGRARGGRNGDAAGHAKWGLTGGGGGAWGCVRRRGGAGEACGRRWRKHAATAASVRETVEHMACLQWVKERASEGEGGSWGAGVWPRSRASGTHGRPCGERRRRMADTGRRCSAAVPRRRARAGGRSGRRRGLGHLHEQAEPEAAAR